MFNNIKKGIAPVVAISLLLVVTVLSVVGFSGWFETYSSVLFVEVESEQNQNFNRMNSGVSGVSGNILFFKNSDKSLEILKIEVDGVLCNSPSSLDVGLNRIVLGTCIEHTGIHEILIVTNQGIYEEKSFIEKNKEYKITLLEDLYPESESGRYITAFENNNKYFLSMKSSLSAEISLVEIDGNEVMIHPQYNGVSVITLFFEYENSLHFVGKNNESKYEIFKFENNNYTQITQLNSEYQGAASKTRPVIFNNEIYFVATLNTTTGSELHKYNSTHGTTLIKDINVGIGNIMYILTLFVFEDKLFFSSRSSLGKNLFELKNGNVIEHNLDLTSNFSTSFSGAGVIYNDRLYMNGNDGTGREIYVYNGSDFNIVQKMNSNNENFVFNFKPIEFDNKLYFSANDGVNGVELFVLDGTTISLVKDMNIGGDFNPESFIEYKNELYFQGNVSSSIGTAIYKLNGGDIQLVSEYRVGPESHYFSYPIVYENLIYYTSKDSIVGSELFSFDGISSKLVKDYNPGINDSFSRSRAYFFLYSDRLYFMANNLTYGTELHYLD